MDTAPEEGLLAFFSGLGADGIGESYLMSVGFRSKLHSILLLLVCIQLMLPSVLLLLGCRQFLKEVNVA